MLFEAKYSVVPESTNDFTPIAELTFEDRDITTALDRIEDRMARRHKNPGIHGHHNLGFAFYFWTINLIPEE